MLRRTNPGDISQTCCRAEYSPEDPEEAKTFRDAFAIAWDAPPLPDNWVPTPEEKEEYYRFQCEARKDREANIAKVNDSACRLVEATARLGYLLGGGRRWHRMQERGGN